MKRVHGSSSTSEESSNVYRITLLGTLNPDWSDRLGGMSITPDQDEDGRRITVLQGHLRDQSALSGILVTVYELHLTILQVELLKDSRWKPQPTRIPDAANGNPAS